MTVPMVLKHESASNCMSGRYFPTVLKLQSLSLSNHLLPFILLAFLVHESVCNQQKLFNCILFVLPIYGIVVELHSSFSCIIKREKTLSSSPTTIILIPTILTLYHTLIKEQPSCSATFSHVRVLLHMKVFKILQIKNKPNVQHFWIYFY